MTRDDGSGTIGGRNDDRPYASGQRKTPSPPKINPPPWTRNPLTKKREYNEEPPLQRYTVTEQNDDVTDGILGGRLLRIELWNMK